jgi:ribosomal protein S18 acetylase RimI-like enzyme
MNNVHVVIADSHDARDLGFIQSQTWLDSYINEERGITREQIQAKVDQWNKNGDERIREEMNKSGAHTWVAKEEDRVVGFTSVLKGVEANTLEALHVLPEYQGQGIGTKLLQKAMEGLGDGKSIRIEVVAYNVRAQKLYKKFGFKVMGEALDDPIILPNGKRIPKVLMVKE